MADWDKEGSLLGGDILSGQEGIAKIKITNKDALKDGDVNAADAFGIKGGDWEDLFYVRNITAPMTVTKNQVRTLGNSVIQHKVSGWEGTGTMTIYAVSSYFQQLMYIYKRTGVAPRFDLVISNDDPASSTTVGDTGKPGEGGQSITLKNCLLDSTDLVKLDTDADFLDLSVEFTYDDWEITSSLKKPAGYM